MQIFLCSDSRFEISTKKHIQRALYPDAVFFSPKIIIEKHHCGLQKQNLVEKDIKHDPFLLLLLATISQNFDKKLP